jgi:uncharacterized membrane protein YbhN (UPF0104 family)
VIKENKKIILGIIKILGLVLILTALYLYGKQLNDNWNYLSTSNIHFNFFWALSAFLFICISYACITLAWHLILNDFNELKKGINFSESISVYNSSQIAKYIPGKIWGYVLQISILKRFGINKSTIIYLNILISFLSILYSFFFGFLFLLTTIKMNLNIAFLIFVLSIILLLLFMHRDTFFSLRKILIKLCRFLGKEINLLKISSKIFMKVNILIFISVLFFGISGYASAIAIGSSFNVQLILPIISSIIVSDAIGFLFLISPGGLGIRELILFKMLVFYGLGTISIFIPVAFRLNNMLADFFLGSLALFMLYKNKAIKK